MNVETFLDYAKILKVVFTVTGERVDYDFICSIDYGDLDDIIIENLKNISSLKETDDPDICILSINNTIFINLNKRTGEIENINQLTSFETRLLAQGKANIVPFSRETKSDFIPKTDLHTHFAGALTTESLLEVGKKHNIGYPAWILEKMGIDTDKYEIDDKGEVLINSIQDDVVA